MTTNDSVAEAKLLAKYKNMRYLNPDDDVLYVIHECNLEFQRGSRKKNPQKGGMCLVSLLMAKLRMMKSHS